MTCIKEHKNMENVYHFKSFVTTTSWLITYNDTFNTYFPSSQTLMLLTLQSADLADQDLFTLDGTPLLQQLGPLLPLPVPVPPAPDQDRPTSLQPPPLTDIAFSLGRKGGRQASYNGFMYSKDKTHNSGTTSW